MDALALIPEEEKIEHTDPFWVGVLSMSIALAVARIEQPRYVREDLKRALEDFLRSPLPSAELKASLREEMRR